LLVGGLITGDDDEVLVIMQKGKIVRSSVAEVSATGRNTMGVIFAKPDPNDRIIKIARNLENTDAEDVDAESDAQDLDADDAGGEPAAEGELTDAADAGAEVTQTDGES